MIRRWFAILVVAVLVCGTVLSLPAFWARPVIGEKSAQIARHWLDCVFTASSALTGTGLSPHEIGEDFNLAGQIVVFTLMQVGGLAVAIAGSVVGWRFRQRCGWGAGDEAGFRTGQRRLVAFWCILMLGVEIVGAVAIYCSTDAAPEGPPRKAFAAVFHAVSACCNNGLTLTHNSLVDQGGRWPVYAFVLPLMVVGSIGGPVLYEIWRRLLGGRARGACFSCDARVTLAGTAGLILVGAAVICFTESTPRWQLRNPREDIPGRLRVDERPTDEPDLFTLGEPSSAARQRMRTMSVGRRAAAALFHSVSARSGGFRVARLDEQSLSPAGRAALAALMLIGGGLGGTGGGLYIIVVAALLGTLWRRRKECGSGEYGHAATVVEGGRDAHPSGVEMRGGRDACIPIAAAAGVLVGIVLVVGFVAMVLIYREPASVEMSLFTAISACTNTGLAVGTLRLLSVEGQVAIVLAMILGRVIPLAVLAGYLKPAPADDSPAVGSLPQEA